MVIIIQVLGALRVPRYLIQHKPVLAMKYAQSQMVQGHRRIPTHAMENTLAVRAVLMVRPHVRGVPVGPEQAPAHAM